MRVALLAVAFSVAFSFAYFGSFAFAAPSINVVSPEETTYTTTKVLINVTSNETVDFYTKAKRYVSYLARNTTNFTSFLYGKNHEYILTIYANNSNGISSKNILYNVTGVSNPISIDSGGQLMSSNTEYRLANDVGTIYYQWMASNVTLDLNGYTISGGFNAEGCTYSKIANGSIAMGGGGSTAVSPGIVAIHSTFGQGCLFRNLTIESSDIALNLEDVNGYIFENIIVRAPVGVYSTIGQPIVTIRNSTFTRISGGEYLWYVGSQTKAGAFVRENTMNDNFNLENVIVRNYTNDLVWLYAGMGQFFVKDSQMNTTPYMPNPDEIWGVSRIFTQHRAIINITDSNGNGISSAVEIVNNNSKRDPTASEYDMAGNPTATIFVATNASGLAETYLTQKVKVFRTESPLSITSVEYPTYTITARTKGVNESINLTMTSNSTFNVNIALPVSDMPACTLEQMLDLNGDGNINAEDIRVVVHKMTNRPVNITSSKNCSALNLLLP